MYDERASASIAKARSEPQTRPSISVATSADAPLATPSRAPGRNPGIHTGGNSMGLPIPLWKNTNAGGKVNLPGLPIWKGAPT